MGIARRTCGRDGVFGRYRRSQHDGARRNESRDRRRVVGGYAFRVDRRAPRAAEAGDVEDFLNCDRYAEERRIGTRSALVEFVRAAKRGLGLPVHERANDRLASLDAGQTRAYKLLARKLSVA